MKSLAGDDLGKPAGERAAPGTYRIKGFDAVRKVTAKPGQPAMEAWYAPSLDCELVQHVVRYGGADSGAEGESWKRLESANLADPDPGFFVVPPGYEEVSPSEMEMRQSERSTGERKLCNPAASQAEDRKYFSQRP